MRLITVLFFLITLRIGSAQIPSPDDAPLPLSPEQSKKHFKLTDGFRIDLIASEPLIRDPSCIAWDSKGRLFVTEIHGYNLEGHLDVTELNKTGKLDKSIRRVRVGPKLKEEAHKGQTGSLKLLRDLDGDGKMDESILWADDIPAAYGIITLDQGVIITAAPHILFFADTNGDNRPDVRKTLFTGFTVGEMERAINNPVMGPDGWIYAGQGWGGGDITGPNLKGLVKMGRTDFRFKADGSAIEPASGSNHTFGMAFDDVGNRFLITTSRPALYAVPLPYHYLKRNPHVGTPNLTATASDYHNTFPTSEPHPWRQKRGADPRWVKFYGAGEAKPNGNFTSACGQQIYRAKLFPESYHGNYFCCDPQQSMVHRAQIKRAGSGIVVQRHPDHSDSEFLTSTDGWFRPNNLRVGPDGALYVIDMYREIIEDYSAIPRYMQQQYGLLNGNDRGRIWRVAPKGSKPFPIKTNRYEPASSVSDRIKSLYESDAKLVDAMKDSHYGVRVHALRVADQSFKTNPELLNAALALIKNESDPNVLLQLALSLGESDDSRSVAGLVQLAARHSDVRWMDNAVLSSIGNKAGSFFELAIKERSKMDASILEQAAQTAARSGDAKLLVAAVDYPDPALRLRILSLAAKNGVDVSGSFRAIADEALSVPDASERQRLAALQLIGYASPDVVESGVKNFLSPTRNPDFQAQAIKAALAQVNVKVAKQLIEYLPRSTPRIASLITEALLAHPETTKQLLSSNTKAQFSALQMYRLLNHEESEIRNLTQSLSLRSSKKSTDQVVHKSYYAALEKNPNLKRGSALFMVHCANCHQFGGQGIAVGPPLDGEAGRPAESLLADVLNPSVQITAGYSTYIGKLKDGTSHTGVLSSESATSLTLLQAAGAKTQILRSDLISLSPIELSLMPSTFSEIMKPEELADIIGYLRNHKSSGSLVLFDDDPGFPGVLSAGKGDASLDWKNCASGRACLTISGFQRYGAQLPGWNFSVKETPQGKGQFRYLRLAMKTIDADGMMIELADNGQFPPNDKPVRTYYVGKNKTGWTSNQLDKKIPTDWKVYTIDLWKNNGDFIITGMAFTTMGGTGNYDRIELLRNDPGELN
jgi:putative membrane-bound dehydrogenase-like protein